MHHLVCDVGEHPRLDPANAIDEAEFAAGNANVRAKLSPVRGLDRGVDIAWRLRLGTLHLDRRFVVGGPGIELQLEALSGQGWSHVPRLRGWQQQIADDGM